MISWRTDCHPLKPSFQDRLTHAAKPTRSYIKQLQTCSHLLHFSFQVITRLAADFAREADSFIRLHLKVCHVYRRLPLVGRVPGHRRLRWRDGNESGVGIITTARKFSKLV